MSEGRPKTVSGMLEQVRRGRKMPWLKRGLVVDVDGTMGTVVGGNASMNIQVRFAGMRHACNCHPTWQTTYYQDGEVVAEYKQKKERGDDTTGSHNSHH